MADILALMYAFERHEEAIRTSPKPYSHMPASWRAIARELVDNGDSRASVAMRMGVSITAVKRWTADVPSPLPAWRIAQQRRIKANDHVPPYVLRPRSWRAA